MRRNTPKVERLQRADRKEFRNAFTIFTDEGVYLQVYSTTIAFKPPDGKVILDRAAWLHGYTHYDRPRSRFLRETAKETRRKIEDGTYLLDDLD